MFRLEVLWQCWLLLTSGRMTSEVPAVPLQEKQNSLECRAGSHVHFRCPCRPEAIESCRFKKNPEDGYIALDGVINAGSKFKYDKNLTGVTLEDCTGEDEGTYVWTCRFCDAEEHFQLQVVEPVIKSTDNRHILRGVQNPDKYSRETERSTSSGSPVSLCLLLKMAFYDGIVMQLFN